MEMIGEEYEHYWETHTFLQSEELDRYLEDASIPSAAAAAGAYYDSSSPEGSAASKNIVSERNRRKKLNERLFALRAVVPKISKMDKASIIKDAIQYIQELREQERAIQAEIWELESSSTPNGLEFDDAGGLSRSNSKRSRRPPPGADEGAAAACDGRRNSDSSSSSHHPPLHLLELRVSSMGEKILAVSLTCTKRRDTMIKLCEIFESLEIKVISANITTFSATILITVFIQVPNYPPLIALFK
ncbi:unnamed protein product [Cuscuta europaea]|uniref:BHLH domain-containing protein n=1 Tax=Cuscuta europaea TaxID=41803 RepID=A0A9P0Z8D7_CUSEU|nr:unnamed protein product [Cuscuta europaea]